MKKSGLKEMPVERVKAALERHGLNDKSLKFVLGVSGGPDSMVMLHLFHRLELNIMAAHVNYKKREDADKDEGIVVSFCKERNIPYEVQHSDYRNAEGNFQNWARDERRNFFMQLKETGKAAAIVTAHHKEDQLETVMQKILRGSSLTSWQGIREREGSWFRPMLELSKQDLLAYAGQHAVPFVHDHTNFESDFARNFIRNEWVPELNRLFPGWDRNVLRLTERGGEYQEMLELIMGQVMSGKNGLKREPFLKLGKNVRKAVVLAMVRRHFPGESVSTAALNSLDPDDLDTGRSLPINASLSLMRDRKVFILFKKEEPAEAISVHPGQLKQEPLMAFGCRFTLGRFCEPDFSRKLYLNTEKLPQSITLRPWQPGDRFQPFGSAGTKKVSDFLTEKKISSAYKKKAAVLTSEDHIYAVIFPAEESMYPPGAIDEGVRCDQIDQECLIIERSNESG